MVRQLIKHMILNASYTATLLNKNVQGILRLIEIDYRKCLKKNTFKVNEEIFFLISSRIGN